MIHFNEDKVSKITKQIKELHDLVDVLNDINKIELAILHVRQYGDLQTARRLDVELRDKYPLINQMIEVARALRPISNLMSVSQIGREVEEIEWLKQDYYGVLCDTALKKGLIGEIEQFIDKVD